MVAALEDVVTPKSLQAAGAEWISDSEFLASVVVVVAKSGEEAFLASYGELDSGAVPLGPEGRRDTLRGSPVVPGSAKCVAGRVRRRGLRRCVGCVFPLRSAARALTRPLPPLLLPRVQEDCRGPRRLRFVHAGGAQGLH